MSEATVCSGALISVAVLDAGLTQLVPCSRCGATSAKTTEMVCVCACAARVHGSRQSLFSFECTARVLVM